MKLKIFHNTTNLNVRASALGYAISFLLLVGLICSGVLFVSSVNKRLEHNYSIEEHLIFDNYFALTFGAKQVKNGHYTLPHPSGDTSQITIKPWGAFRVVVATTHHGLRKETRTALVGDKTDISPVTLYLPDNRQALKVGGDTKIEGTVSISERGIERAYIAGKNYSNDKLVYGTQLKSERFLPVLNQNVRNISLESFYLETQKTEWPIKDSVYSFHEKTSLITQIEPLIIDQKITGNIIIHSFDSILVKSTAFLENVILIAPRIRFEKGFRGNVQAIAHETIVCEEEVFLDYPSVLILNENQPNTKIGQNGIFLEPKSKVLGGVLLVSQSPDFRKPVYLSINDALIAGNIYNQGNSEVKGTIAGSIYTQQFYLRAGGGEYVNHLLDAKISSALLPDDFVSPQWIESIEKKKPILLACF